MIVSHSYKSQKHRTVKVLKDVYDQQVQPLTQNHCSHHKPISWSAKSAHFLTSFRDCDSTFSVQEVKFFSLSGAGDDAYKNVIVVTFVNIADSYLNMG